MKFKFDDIAINSTKKKIPEESDKNVYIGLEHIDSESFTITRWGAEAAPIGDKLLMRKGDVLFGKRRAYQRKVAIAPFDGIFSAHGMVLRPKENVVTKEFFPFFISSDQFMERAVRISVGGLSPTVNWKDLKEQEFELPSIDEQKVLAEKLWAAYRLKESYKKLLAATDEMVKSRFIEMFGDTKTSSKGFPVKTFEELCETITDGEHITPVRSETGIYLLSARNIANGKLLLDPVDYISEKEYLRIARRIIPAAGDVLVSCSGSVGRVCVLPSDFKCQLVRSVALLRFRKEVSPFFMQKQIMSQDVQSQIDLLKSKTSQANIFQGNLRKLKGVVPPRHLQDEYLAFVEQADKSGFELRKSIENIDSVIKSLINN